MLMGSKELPPCKTSVRKSVLKPSCTLLLALLGSLPDASRCSVLTARSPWESICEYNECSNVLHASTAHRSNTSAFDDFMFRVCQASSKKPVVVYYTKLGCPPCYEFEMRTLFAEVMNEFAKSRSVDTRIVAVEPPMASLNDVMKKADVKDIPTLQIYCRQKRMVTLRVGGFYTKSQLNNAIENILKQCNWKFWDDSTVQRRTIEKSYNIGDVRDISIPFGDKHLYIKIRVGN